MLRAMGVPLELLDASFEGPQRPRGRHLEIPGDPSSAAFLLAAPLIVRDSGVNALDVCMNRTRIGFVDAVARMGGTRLVSVKTLPMRAGVDIEPLGTFTAHGEGELRACALEGELVVRAIDEVPILAVLAAFAR